MTRRTETRPARYSELILKRLFLILSARNPHYLDIYTCGAYQLHEMTFEMVPYSQPFQKKYLCEKQSSLHFLSLKVIGLEIHSNYRANLGMQESEPIQICSSIKYGIQMQLICISLSYKLTHAQQFSGQIQKLRIHFYKCNQLKVITPSCAVQNQSYL
ncbi:Hypothetical_protein [Hexamita inflata]|uniref:Hypothetical_protein n=1 Tax=Hexamita inflata TaxID=28002 RepID=A0AA86PWY8_9EUKA|nr:Hypothetical protein HINF_LOCUS35226 [Hexamita inflata]